MTALKVAFKPFEVQLPTLGLDAHVQILAIDKSVVMLGLIQFLRCWHIVTVARSGLEALLQHILHGAYTVERQWKRHALIFSGFRFYDKS